MKLVQAMPIGLLLFESVQKIKISYMNRMNKFVGNNESIEYRKESVV